MRSLQKQSVLSRRILILIPIRFAAISTDFLFQKNDDTYVIVEVKGDHEIDNPVVQAKKTFAEAIAGASKMTYRMLESSKANAGIHSMLFEDELQAS